MNQAVATLAPRQKSVTLDMADRFGMEARAFEQTLRATVFPSNGPPEQFAAFLLVAKQYDLNPITKEIYAFPSRGGGIVPIVSIDGWLKLINSHPQFDGMDFEDIHDGEGRLTAVKCTMFRKDRSHPIVVAEYLEECKRPTDPWKMAHRMLRHKAVIQCARYAFGFAGIYDPDEGEKIAEATGAPRGPGARTPPAPPPIAAIAAPAKVETPASEPAKPKTPPNPNAAPAPVTPTVESILAEFKRALDAATNEDACNAAWDSIIEAAPIRLDDNALDEAQALLREGAQRFYEASE